MRTSTCSDDHVSMLSDLTFDMCVPSLRWREAHRMQRKTPSYQTIRQYPVRDFFTTASFTLPGCVGEDAFNTYVPAGPTCRQCQLLESRADIWADRPGFRA